MMAAILPWIGFIVRQQMSSLSQDWLISVKDPRGLWNDNWLALVVEVVFLAVFALACRHAMGKGLRSSCFLCSCFLAALGLEFLQMIPHTGYQLWWYHQGMVNILQRRVPLYVVCFTSSLYYSVHCLNERMNLPVLTQSLVNAVACSLVAFPCLALAPNFLLLLFHFDDPIFQDRLLNVPYAQATYLFLLFFHMGHYFNSGFEAIGEPDRQLFRYIRCAVESGIFSALFSLVELYLLYTFWCNVFHLRTALCLVSAVAILCLMAKDEILQTEVKSFNFKLVPSSVRGFLCLVLAFGLVLSAAAFVRPENLKSSGERLELGPCDELQAVSNMSPLDTTRRRYICTEDQPKFGFDFHCVSARPHPRAVHRRYTICGTPFAPGLESTLMWYTVPCLAVFYVMLSSSVTLAEKKLEGVEKKLL